MNKAVILSIAAGAIALAAIAAVIALSQGDSVAEAWLPGPPSELEGRWEMVESDGVPVPQEFPVWFTFTEGTFTVEAVCWQGWQYPVTLYRSNEFRHEINGDPQATITAAITGCPDGHPFLEPLLWTGPVHVWTIEGDTSRIVTGGSWTVTYLLER